ncbi:MAG: hypothetical protein Q9170_000599 [Blastenia crenularia]
MHFLITSYQVLCYIAIACALPGPLSSATANLSLSSPRLAAGRFPPPPTNFKTTFKTIKPRRHLPTRLVYPLVISFFRERQRLDWDAAVNNELSYRLPPPSNIKIDVRPVEPNQLQNSHVMLAIYEAVRVLRMSSHGMPPTRVKIALADKVIGTIDITHIDSGTAVSKRDQVNSAKENNSTLTGIGNDIWSGRIVDPADARNAVVFHHRGRVLREEEQLMLLMQALIIITYDGRYVLFNSMYAVSQSGGCAMYMHALGRDRPDPSYVAEMVALLVGAFYPSMMFYETEFVMEYGRPERRRDMVNGRFVVLL